MRIRPSPPRFRGSRGRWRSVTGGGTLISRHALRPSDGRRTPAAPRPRPCRCGWCIHLVREGGTHRVRVPAAPRFERWPGNPNADEIFGLAASDSLTDVPGRVDAVGLFRPSEDVPGVVAAALERDDVAAIWMQPGLRDDLAARDAEAAGLDVVQERCKEVEHGPPVRTP